ncbi:MAG: hypothetical protein PHE73_08770 [Sulfurovaceae bacterium]|nr:hypothetical protein [Sulfurovaceae bacterium]
MKNGFFKTCLQQNILVAVQLTITVIGLISTVLAVYITYRLAPLQQSQIATAKDVDELSIEHKQFAKISDFNILSEDVRTVKKEVNALYLHFLK